MIKSRLSTNLFLLIENNRGWLVMLKNITVMCVVISTLSACSLIGMSEPMIIQSKCQPLVLPTLSTQQTATLAFVAYAGDQLINTDPNVDKTLQSCVSNELTRQPILDKQYTLAWGPAAYRFNTTFFDDNMMYAVNDLQNSGHLIIAIRGTNPESISDWFVEDFYVYKTRPWQYAKPFNKSARISQATHIGLSVLQNLQGKVHGALLSTSSVVPSTSAPIAPESKLFDYLKARARNKDITKITVTGHSLAGALAPVLALWLKDTESSWNPTPSWPITINVLPIAGATSGNAEFAAYYNQRLGKDTLRLHNEFDVVPKAWYSPTMRKLTYIYNAEKQNIKPNWYERWGFWVGRYLSSGKEYTQICAAQPALKGVINPAAEYNSYATQAEWQHHCGYYNILGLTKNTYKVNSNCVTPPPSNKPLCNAVPIQ